MGEYKIADILFFLWIYHSSLHCLFFQKRSVICSELSPEKNALALL